MNRNEQTLTSFQASMKAKNATFVPFVLRAGMPVPMTMFGPANLTFEDAEARVREALATGMVTAGWVVSKKDIREVR